VQRTGLASATFRAWERRYHFPTPFRTSTRQRLYSERDIAALRWLAEQTRRGVAISRAVDILRSGRASVADTDTPTRTRQHLDELRARLTDALLGFDTERAETILGETMALFPFEDACMELLVPMLVDVGERWHAGTLSVAEEHFVSSFVRTRLSALMAVYSHDGGGPLVFAGAVAGELHELGVLMLAVFLLRQGYQVRYLGPNLPADSLRGPIERLRPAALLLSCHAREGLPELLAVAALLDSMAPPRPVLIYGGRLFDRQPALRARVPGTYAGPDARLAQDQIGALLRPRSAGSAG
jgi:MerR family transcriptional regulator, light-induced transcriptional regulator